MSTPTSLRLPESTLTRLRTRARDADLAPRTLAQRYIEEGLRMDAHPLVRFVDGPAGRRASVIGAGDVWELVAAVRDNAGDPETTAEHLELPLGTVQAAISYYGAYREEIDAQIERNEREALEAEAAWRAGRSALAG